MNITNVLSLIVVALCMLGCRNINIENTIVSKSASHKAIEVDMDGLNMSIGKYVNDFFYVPLETSTEALINEIKKVKSDNGIFFVLDTKQDAIFFFDKKGKFLRKISKRGKGPDEYISLNDFYLNKQEKQIEICDHLRSRVLVFDYMANFVAIKSFNSEIAASFAISEKQYFFHHEDLHSKNDDCTIINTITNNEFRAKFRPFRGVDKFYSPKVGSPIAVSGKDIYSVFLCNPNIYRLSNGRFEVAFTLDFGITENINTIIDKYRNKSEDIIRDILVDYEYPTALKNFNIADEILYLTIIGNKDRRVLHFYYDMKNGNSISVRGLNYVDRCIVDPGFVVGTTGKSFISAINADRMIQATNNYSAILNSEYFKDKEGFRKLESITKSLDSNSNPVLMVFKPNV